ncbi:MocR-like pyridoxine biosynthesis transcription factor PdxR [Paenibacillus jiagnxiensis]|uniref:MocR-like pyridoxine biosynthesis transcription factor PdxR n=1 Tax=Paenibacillus jiagnxiensis TaxID=3228926 RepID=UPI0033ACBE45
MHIELSRHSSTKLYSQIAVTLGDRIRSGLMAPGTKLLSVRNLSAQLSVSQVTVSKAYAELEAEGLITCSQGKGCYVSAGAGEATTGDEADLSWQLSLMDYLPRAQLWHNFNHVLPARYQFHKAAIQEELLPTREVVANVYKMLSDDPALMANYGSFSGDFGLRKALASVFNESGMTVTAENLLITSGAQQGIDLVARTFVGPGDVVYMEAPSYTGAIDVFASRGAKIIMVPMDEEGMKVDMLTKLCDLNPPKLIYCIPTFHNPTGVTMSMRRRRQLVDLAQSYHCLIVEDDPFSSLYYNEPPPHPIKCHDQAGHVIYIRSYSKTLAPGCRIACMAAHGSVLSRLIAAKSTTDLGSPLMTQKALQPFIEARLEQHLEQLRTVLRRRLQLALTVLRKHAPADLSWNVPEGGLNLWLKLPAYADPVSLERRAEQAGVSFLPGGVCYAGEADSRHIRVSFTYPAEDKLQEGLKLLCGLIAESRTASPERKPVL